MNNNNNGNKGKESDIITKKGFLISLPGKKNAPDTQSSINLAKPKVEAVQNSGSSDGADKKKFDKKNNKHGKNNRFNKNNNHAENKNVAENKPEVKNNNNPEKENKNIAMPSENKHEKHDRRDGRDGQG